MRKKHEPRDRRESNVSPKFEQGEETVILPDCIIIRETERAFLVRPESWEGKGLWFPKSKVVLHTHAKDKRLHDVEMPQWLAKEKDVDV